MSIIPDRELILSEQEDFFKTRAYSDAIFNLIEEHDGKERLTIGLFGGWGTGKSSIIRTLKDRLQTSQQTATILYDAWKYSEDAFRRSFLLEVKNQLGLSPEATFEEFYFDKSEDIDHKVRLTKLPLALTLPIFVLGIIVGFIGIIEGIRVPQFPWWVPVIGGFGFVVISFLLQFIIKNLLIVYRVSRTTPRLFSAEQFECVFKEALQAVTKGKKSSVWKYFKGRAADEKRKIVIIVDNVDRCHNKLASELLLTIKNFLEVPDCIFVIPVDDEAIRKHLGFSGTEGAEFLRKFFTTTVRIRKYSPTDFFEFTNALIKKYNLGFGIRIADIISQVFVDNPRRIIQFLNNLSLEVMVGREQEEMGTIVKGVVTGNVEFLAKLQVIREEWPDLYARISREPYLLSEVENLLRKNAFKRDENSAEYTATETPSISLSEGQCHFLRQTIAIGVTSIDPFLRLRDFDTQVPARLPEHLKNGEWDGIKALLQSGKVTLDKVSEKLRGSLDEATKRGLIDRQTTLFNLFFAIVADENYGPKCKTLCEDMESHLDAGIITLIPHLNAPAMVSYSKSLNKQGKAYLRDFIVTSLNQNEGKDADLLKAYVLGYRDDHDSLGMVRVAFTKRMQENEVFLQDSEYKGLLEDAAVAPHLVDRSVVGKLIAEITSTYPDPANRLRVRILKALANGNVLTAKDKSDYLIKVQRFAAVDKWEQMSFWLEAMAGFVVCAEHPEATGLIDVLRSRQDFLQNNVVSHNQQDETILGCLFAFQNILCEYYLATRANDSQSVDWLLLHFVSNNFRIISHVCEVFIRIVDFFKPFTWPFAQKVIDRLNNVSDFAVKDPIASVLVRMIQKTVDDGGGKMKGLEKGQITKIVSQFVGFLVSADDDGAKKAMEWLSRASEAELARPIIEGAFEAMSDQTKVRKVLPLVGDSISEKTRGTMIRTLVQSNTDYEKLSSNVKTGLSLPNGAPHVKDGLRQLLAQTTIKNIDNLESVLRVCVDNQELFNGDAIEQMIDDKVVPILSQEFPHAILACKELMRLKTIPKSKHALLATVVGRIRVPDGDQKKDGEAVLAKLKERFKESA